MAETAVATHSFAVLGSSEVLFLLLAIFYFSEIMEAIHIFVCDLGFFYPVIYDNKLLERFNIRGNGALLITIGILALFSILAPVLRYSTEFLDDRLSLPPTLLSLFKQNPRHPNACLGICTPYVVIRDTIN